MSAEIETHMESLEEHIHEAAEHGDKSWIKWAALMTSLLAVFAAGTGLISGTRENEGVLEQIRASDQWSFYQAKGMKQLVLESEREMLLAMHQQVPEGLDKRVDRYSEEQVEIKKSADELTAESQKHLEQHHIFAHAVTLFQIAIAMTAVAMLSQRRWFLVVSFVFSGVAMYYLIAGFLV